MFPNNKYSMSKKAKGRIVKKFATNIGKSKKIVKVYKRKNETYVANLVNRENVHRKK